MLAITLVRRDLKEFDQIISFYTAEKGKIDVLAKGIKKITSKNSANLEPPSLLELEVVTGKDLDHLTKVQSVDSFKNIRSDLSKSFLAGYAVQVLNGFTLVGEKDERIFNLLLSFLNYLNSEAVPSPLDLINSYLLKLWSLFGYGEELKKLSKLSPEQMFVMIDKFVQLHNGKPLPDFVKNAKKIGII